jgi:hypothetical protein
MRREQRGRSKNFGKVASSEVSNLRKCVFDSRGHSVVEHASHSPTGSVFSTRGKSSISFVKPTDAELVNWRIRSKITVQCPSGALQ